MPTTKLSNEQILTEAIRRAVAGGWQAEPLGGAGMWPEFTEGERRYIIQLLLDGYEDLASPYMIVIYNHDFAKALWGVTEVHHYDLVDLDNGGKTEVVNKPRWHYHLQQMVIAEDPLKYLGENLHD